MLSFSNFPTAHAETDDKYICPSYLSNHLIRYAQLPCLNVLTNDLPWRTCNQLVLLTEQAEAAPYKVDPAAL